MEDVLIGMNNCGREEDILVRVGNEGISIGGYLTRDTAAKLRDELNKLLARDEGSEFRELLAGEPEKEK